VGHGNFNFVFGCFLRHRDIINRQAALNETTFDERRWCGLKLRQLGGRISTQRRKGAKGRREGLNGFHLFAVLCAFAWKSGA
jgi:hypothetical protein